MELINLSNIPDEDFKSLMNAKTEEEIDAIYAKVKANQSPIPGESTGFVWYEDSNGNKFEDFEQSIGE